MKRNLRTAGAFSLTELLVVIAVLAILAALMLPALGRAKAKAERTTCMNNLRQINLGIRMYSDDERDATPSPAAAADATNFATLYSAYKRLAKNYLGGSGTSSPPGKLFACPADKFYPNHIFYNDNGPTVNVPKSLYEEPYVDFSSYSFNGGDGRSEVVGKKGVTITRPGLGNVKLSAVKHPARTALVTEASAFAPWSWHDPAPDVWFNDAQNMVSFVDGHVSYIKIFLDETPQKGIAIFYDPPDRYEYQWSPD